MKLTRLSIDRPVTTAMFFLAVVLFGFVSLRELSVDLLPDINTPKLSVLTQYPGVAPEEIEKLITMPLESAVSQIPGMRRVESISREGISYLTLELTWGTDMDFTLLHLKEKIDSVREALPEDTEDPTIITLNPQSQPVMVLAVFGERGLLELKEFAEELIKPRLEQIEGIGSAEITGGVEREIQVDINPDLLSLYGFTIDQVASRINAFNQNLQGGTIRKGLFKYAIRVVGEFESLSEVEEMSLKITENKGIIRLKDIARVRDSLKEREGMTRLNRKESIGILVRKESGANTVKVTRIARNLIGQIQKENPRIRVQIVSEQAKYIEQAISSVVTSLILGGILAFLVLVLFLQELRTPLIISAVIPISVIGTFNLLYYRHITLNIMSLGGLALGVGMLVDASIVVSENIFRHKSLGKSLPEAAYTGTKEVGMAVAATVFTTIAVFLPVIYVHGVAGQLFKDQALTVTFSLLSSLFISLTLLPMLESRQFDFQKVETKFPGKNPSAQKETAGKKRKFKYLVLPIKGIHWLLYAVPKGIFFVANVILSFFLQLFLWIVHYLSLPFRPAVKTVFKVFNFAYKGFSRRYEQFLMWSLNNKVRVIAGAMVFFGGTILLGTQIRRELMPKVEAASFELFLRTPENYSLEQTSDVVGLVENFLAGQKDVALTFSQTGIVSGMEGLNPEISLNSGQIHVRVKNPDRMEPVLEILRQRLASIPDLHYSLLKEQSTLAQFLAFSTAEIGLRIKGDDLIRLEAISEKLAGKLKDVRGIADLDTNIGEGKTEFLIQIKKDALGKYPNISSADIGNFIVHAVRGRLASQYNELEKKYDILVRLEEKGRENIDALLNAHFPYQGVLIPLRELVTREVVRGPKEIRRENQQREVLLTANLHGTKISQVVPAVQKIIAGLSLPSNYRIVFSGEAEEMRRSFRSLILAFLLAIGLTYMIMAAQFESLLHPFLILFTLPMGVSGSILALLVTGKTVNVISVIGAVVLVGIVVNDAIVKIDCTNQLRKAGLGLREAVVEASHIRLRPILMTTVTTIFGLLPMAVGIGKGSELQQPLAIVVIGGLIVSTFLTLILIPVIYEWTENWKAKKS
ncbi:MAG: efflux RND transporter permease subunit [Candidatus Aminicenantales bacterium]